MTPQDGYHFSDQIGHLLRRVYQRHAALFQQYIPDSQLTAAQFVVLCSVRDNKGSSLADIVKATVIDQATIRGVVDRLKQRVAAVPGMTVYFQAVQDIQISTRASRSPAKSS